MLEQAWAATRSRWPGPARHHQPRASWTVPQPYADALKAADDD